MAPRRPCTRVTATFRLVKVWRRETVFMLSQVRAVSNTQMLRRTGTADPHQGRSGGGSGGGSDLAVRGETTRNFLYLGITSTWLSFQRRRRYVS